MPSINIKYYDDLVGGFKTFVTEWCQQVLADYLNMLQEEGGDSAVLEWLSHLISFNAEKDYFSNKGPDALKDVLNDYLDSELSNCSRTFKQAILNDISTDDIYDFLYEAYARANDPDDVETYESDSE